MMQDVHWHMDDEPHCKPVHTKTSDSKSQPADSERLALQHASYTRLPVIC